MKTLATRARTVLAGGRHALLTLPRHDVRGWTGLIDDGGEPVLLVGAGSPPTAAAGTVRRCRIDVPGTAGERLVLAGALRAVPGTAEQVARRIAGPGLTVVVPYDGADELAAHLPDAADRATLARAGAALAADPRCPPAGVSPRS
jgi:hypothetical protein